MLNLNPRYALSLCLLGAATWSLAQWHTSPVYKNHTLSQSEVLDELVILHQSAPLMLEWQGQGACRELRLIEDLETRLPARVIVYDTTLGPMTRFPTVFWLYVIPEQEITIDCDRLAFACVLVAGNDLDAGVDPDSSVP